MNDDDEVMDIYMKGVEVGFDVAVTLLSHIGVPSICAELRAMWDAVDKDEMKAKSLEAFEAYADLRHDLEGL
jgi:hypothetical protein